MEFVSVSYSGKENTVRVRVVLKIAITMENVTMEFVYVINIILVNGVNQEDVKMIVMVIKEYAIQAILNVNVIKDSLEMIAQKIFALKCVRIMVIVLTKDAYVIKDI